MRYKRKLNNAIFFISAVLIILCVPASFSSASLNTRSALWTDWNLQTSSYLKTSSYLTLGNVVFPGFGSGQSSIPSEWAQNSLAPLGQTQEVDNGSLMNGYAIAKITAADQVALELTVYNNNLALVKDIRKITENSLPLGPGELLFEEVASEIIPSTVIVKSQTSPTAFTVLEQTFKNYFTSRYDLLDEYVGKTIKLVDWNEYHNTMNVVEATLLGSQYEYIYKINGDIYLQHPGDPVLPALPEDFSDKPTLWWSYENSFAGDQILETSYLTNNISWSADYILILNAEENLADISSWVTIVNQSGATYKNAQLRLVAGQVQRRMEPIIPYYPQYGGLYGAVVNLTPVASVQFEEEATFEYHTYDLGRTTTIKDKKTKQISMLEASGVVTEKELLVEGGIISYLTGYYGEDEIRLPVNVYIKFKNSEASNLGLSLPAGVMHIYQEDNNGYLWFIGEDKITHTPIDEEVKLYVGDAFDIVAERIQTDYKLVSQNVHESEWEITLRNHKEEDVVVSIKEQLRDDWEIINSTHPYEQIDAFTIRFDIEVSKEEEVKVNYRVRITEESEIVPMPSEYYPIPGVSPEYYPMPAGAPY
ncbi:MAG: DUF4139 domain-containing protein [bacterium]